MTNMIVEATMSVDTRLAGRSGNVTAQHPDSSTLGDDGLVEGVDGIDRVRRVHVQCGVT